MTGTPIPTLRNLTTGEIAPAHRFGTDTAGAVLYGLPDGWEPVLPAGLTYALDEDGNFTVEQAETTTTTIPHTTYATAYSSAVITLCDECHARGAYPTTHAVEPYRSDDPDRCAECGRIYDRVLAERTARAEEDPAAEED